MWRKKEDVHLISSDKAVPHIKFIYLVSKQQVCKNDGKKPPTKTKKHEWERLL